jgi:transcriptional regulator with XRE-family HTH domain
MAKGRAARIEEIAQTLRANLGNSLRAEREKAGLSQEQFGRTGGLRQRDVSELESGQRNLTSITLARVGDAILPSAPAQEVARLIGKMIARGR